MGWVCFAPQMAGDRAAYWRDCAARYTAQAIDPAISDAGRADGKALAAYCTLWEAIERGEPERKLKRLRKASQDAEAEQMTFAQPRED